MPVLARIPDRYTYPAEFVWEAGWIAGVEGYIKFQIFMLVGFGVL